MCLHGLKEVGKAAELNFVGGCAVLPHDTIATTIVASDGAMWR
jgi:hypothetical protein